MVQTVAPFTSSETGLGAWPCEGGQVIKAVLVFNGVDDVELDLSAFQSTGHFSAAQTIFVNNVSNANVVTITMNQSDQVFQCPVGGFMYMPMLLPNPPKILFSCSNVINIVVHIINFFLPPVIWGPTLGGGGAGIVAPATPNDLSNVIAVGGTPQIAIAANVNRIGFIISNPSTAIEILQFSLGVGTALIDLLPGATYESGIVDWMGIVQVVAATGGHAYTAYEGT